MINFDILYENLTTSFTDFQILITALSYVFGVGLMFRGLAMFRTFGQHITQMSQRGEVVGPLLSILCGTALVYLPSTINFTTITLFNNPPMADLQRANVVLAYFDTTLDEYWQCIWNLVVRYTHLIGLFAFVRGIYILSKSAEPSAGQQSGNLTKGIVHVVAGVLAMNVIETIVVVARSVGFKV